ncbi:KGGVGR-motif variant AAA ATPase [Hymenobacter convexus]|uniref:KGGVGR-motif variant AAA ATPase n=1 Tax=Hymenobacter sp. CA1UV-4 TaxID=3063782 RepID=UPI00271327A1|nr:AAA family ATPase [Hymenobacter sp. CA1UV-4]MDO7853844.1 AAA family ATPase [Hymenobacter sp. CA1UV-4]
MGIIITFYSYKGGVGRSMALANIAVELAKRQQRVLVVDWDLEAPGVERYFSAFKIENTSAGLLQLLLAFEKDSQPDYKEYLWKVDFANSETISLLHSGREKDPASYSSLLQNFDWADLFANKNGGYQLEALREAWQKDFDYVLIDSRTGLSDSSGICTILMPDVLVPMFTANYQSLFGIRDIIKYIQAARQKLAVDRMALTVLPIPSRFGTRVEFKESQEWLERIADILKECYSDWLPKWIEPKYILEQTKIPQFDYFSFGEKLAVVEQGTSDPESMGFIFSKIAALLLTKFAGIEDFVGREYYQARKKEHEEATVASGKNESEFNYDVYLSCSRDAYNWVKELLLPALTEYLGEDLGYNPQIYFDISQVSPEESFSTHSESVLQQCKTCVFVVSGSEVDMPFIHFELSSLIRRESANSVRLLFPVLYRSTESQNSKVLPAALKDRVYTDFSAFKYEDTIKSTRLRSQFGQEVEKLSSAIAASINQNGKLPEKYVPRIPGADDLEELMQLAKDYEEVRRKMPGSSNRTRVMDNLFLKMKDAIVDPSTTLVEKLSDSQSPGKRLAAIAKLQKFPDLTFVDWLAHHVGAAEKPFVGYQATVALYIASREFGEENKARIHQVLTTALSAIQADAHKDPNQVDVIQAALSELGINESGSNGFDGN